MAEKKYGHFDDANREYVITDPKTPWPWTDIPNNLAQNFVGMALGYVVYYAFQKKGS